MATQPPDQQQTKEQQPVSIHASVERSLFSFAVGQIKIHISRSQRQSPRDKLRELMPSACQAQIDWLLEHAHFSARELLLACRMGGLVAPRGVLRQSRIAVVDTVWSLTCIVILVALVLASGLLMGSALSMSQRLTLVGVTTAMLVTMVGVLSIGVWPHVTARKAVRALERRARESITDDV